MCSRFGSWSGRNGRRIESGLRSSAECIYSGSRHSPPPRCCFLRSRRRSPGLPLLGRRPSPPRKTLPGRRSVVLFTRRRLCPACPGGGLLFHILPSLVGSRFPGASNAPIGVFLFCSPTGSLPTFPTRRLFRALRVFPSDAVASSINLRHYSV